MTRQLARVATTLAAVAAMAACNADALNVRDFNRPTVEGVAQDPNGIQLLATGILDAERDMLAGMISDFGVFGRESYQYSTTDARSVSNYLIGLPGPRLDPQGFAANAGTWGNRYQNMRNVKAFLATVDASTTLSAAQKQAAKGFANTIYALDVMYLIISRDTLGVPVAVTDVITEPAPFVTRDSAYKFIIGTLDQAKTDLSAGGAAFPFTMHTGWAGFNTPATFLRFNRAMAARANAYRGSLGCGASCYQAALTALNETGMPALGAAVTRASLDVGVYHIYSTTPGDTQNGASAAVNGQLYAHAQPITGAVAGDLRRAKLTPLAAPVPSPGVNNGIAATQKFAIYPNPNSPAPLFRTEELHLLRAEANIMTGNAAAALQDINAVRTVSGGLPALATLGTTQAAQLDALLYENWMSLLFEGHRWHDMRRYGRLSQLPLDLPNHFVARVVPIPNAECLARVVINKPSAGC